MAESDSKYGTKLILEIQVFLQPAQTGDRLGHSSSGGLAVVFSLDDVRPIWYK